MNMFDKIYQYNFPTTIRFGAGAVDELPDYLVKNNLKSPLIVTDPVVASLDFSRKSFQTSKTSISLLMFLLTSIKTLLNQMFTKVQMLTTNQKVIAS